MDVQSIIQTVNSRTEKRAAAKLDLRMEFFLALDEFCLDQHFYWRSKRARVQLVLGQQLYDISTAAPDFSEFKSVYLIGSDGVTVSGCALAPLLDETAQISASLNATQDTPSGYFLDTTQSLKNITLQAPSNVAQLLVFTYWALPQVSDADPDDNAEDMPIPLVPAYLHWVLQYALERRVYEFLYGQEDPRFTVANAKYEQGKAIAARVPSWFAGKVVEARIKSHHGIAVQAHS